MSRGRRSAGSGWHRRAGEVLLLLGVGLILIEPMWLLRGDLGPDDSTYWSHAATLALDLDFDFSNEPVGRWSANGRVPVGSPGAGWAAAPFVAAFSLVDRVQDHPVLEDHSRYLYSWSFFGLFAAALFYFLLGVWLYRRALRTLWPGLDPRLNLLLAFSTGVPYYALRHFSTSHAAEFAACALGVWAAVGLYRAIGRGEGTRPWLLLSALAVLANLTIRINNLNTIVLGHAVVLLLFVFGTPGLPRLEWGQVRKALVRLSGAALVGLVPLVLYNLEIYGVVYPTPSQMYGQPLEGTATRTLLEMLLHGLSLVPNLVPLVFGSEWGVLYTNPVLVLGGVYLLFELLRRAAAERDLPHALALLTVVGYLGLSTAIVLWWQTTASFYGYRYLLPLYPITLLGLLMAAHGASWQRSRIRRALLPAAVGLALVSVLTMTMFNATDELEVRAARNVFGQYHRASATGFMTTLPGELVEPETWVSLPARRLAGFLVADQIVATPALRERVPEPWLASYRRIYGPTPPAVLLQLLVALAGWVAAASWLIRRPAGAGSDVAVASQTSPN